MNRQTQKNYFLTQKTKSSSQHHRLKSHFTAGMQYNTILKQCKHLWAEVQFRKWLCYVARREQTIAKHTCKRSGFPLSCLQKNFQDFSSTPKTFLQDSVVAWQY